jgi:hypothetical protein
MNVNRNKHKNGQAGSRAAAAGAPAAQFNEIKSLLTEMAAEIEGFKQAAGGSITDVMAGWVATQYLLAARKELAAQPDGPERFALLRQMAGDVSALQRGSQRAARLQLDREKLQFEREKHQAAVAAASPENRKRPDYFRPLTDEERRAIVAKVDDVLGIKEWEQPDPQPNVGLGTGPILGRAPFDEPPLA